MLFAAQQQIRILTLPFQHCHVHMLRRVIKTANPATSRPKKPIETERRPPPPHILTRTTTVGTHHLLSALPRPHRAESKVQIPTPAPLSVDDRRVHAVDVHELVAHPPVHSGETLGRVFGPILPEVRLGSFARPGIFALVEIQISGKIDPKNIPSVSQHCPPLR